MNRRRQGLSAAGRHNSLDERPIQNGAWVVQKPVRRAASAMSAHKKGPTHKPTTPRRKSSGALPSMDKVSMLIMEVNEISQILHKDYVFTKHGEANGTDELTLVKVQNRKYGISCIWTVFKLKERLVKMRKLMYAAESESAGISGESVFFDPSDDWTKESVTETIDSDMNVASTLEQALEALSKEKYDQSSVRDPAGRGPADGHSSPVVEERCHAPVQEVLQAYEDLSSRTTGDSKRVPTRSKSATPQLRLTGERQHLRNGSNMDLRQSSVSNNEASTGSSHRPPSTLSNGLASTLSSTTSSELPAESEFLLTSTLSDSGDSGFPEKYLTGSPHESLQHIPSSHQPESPRRSAFSTSSVNKSRLPQKKVYPLQRDKAVSHTAVMVTMGTQTDQDTKGRGTSIVTLCKEMVNMTLERVRGPVKHESLVDRILCSCESVKVGVINILEAYIQERESPAGTASFAESEVMKLTSMQLVASLELLVSHTSLWAASFQNNHIPLIEELSRNIKDNVKDLAGELVAFLQGCENDLETLAQDSSDKIIDLLFDLVKYCGQLSMATETQPSCLQDPEGDTLLELIAMQSTGEQDMLQPMPSADLKQSFLSGCDQFVEDTLQSSIPSIQACESKIQQLAEVCHKHSKGAEADEVLKHVYIVLATSKILVLKSQEVQMELNAIMKEEDIKSEHYYYHYHQRCLALLSQLNPLVDSLSLVTQATQPLIIEPDAGTPRKICRCTEMIQRCAHKLLTACTSTGYNFSTSSSSSEASAGANGFVGENKQDSQCGITLKATHQELITRAGNDVAMATQTLIDMLKKRFTNDDSSAGKAKRMLPATPRSMAARPITPKSFMPPSSRPPLLRAKSASNRNRLIRNSWHSFDNYSGSSEV